MKKHLRAWLVAAALLLLIPITAFAALPKVIDDADLLTNEEFALLEARIANLEPVYQMDIVILAVPSIGNSPAWSYADAYYDAYQYADDGVLFLLAMEERDWYISTTGRAINLVSDGEIRQMGDDVVPWLSEGNYYRAFDAWLTALDRALVEGGISSPGSSHGPSPDYDPAEIKAQERSLVSIWSVSLLIGVVIAAVVVLIMRRSMNTKRKQQGAADYLEEGSFQLYTNQDIFLYSSVSKSAKQTSSSSGSGGGGGRSHGGGGGKF